MITAIRTATAFPRKAGEAVSWAKEIAAMVKRITGKEQVVATSFGGLLADIAWIGQYDGKGQYDELRAKVLTDDEFIDALRKAQHLFVPGSGRDQFWNHE